MPHFKIIKESYLKEALQKTRRQYLVGNLLLPQILKHIHSDAIEIAINNYTGGEFEKPHFHPKQIEFELILSEIFRVVVAFFKLFKSGISA